MGGVDRKVSRSPLCRPNRHALDFLVGNARVSTGAMQNGTRVSTSAGHDRPVLAHRRGGSPSLDGRAPPTVERAPMPWRFAVGGCRSRSRCAGSLDELRRPIEARAHRGQGAADRGRRRAAEARASWLGDRRRRTHRGLSDRSAGRGNRHCRRGGRASGRRRRGGHVGDVHRSPIVARAWRSAPGPDCDESTCWLDAARARG
jgi:hypothetical protein